MGSLLSEELDFHDRCIPLNFTKFFRTPFVEHASRSSARKARNNIYLLDSLIFLDAT